MRTLTGPEVPIYGVAFSPDGNIIAAAFADGHVRVWRTSDGRALHDLTIGPGQALGVAIDRTGRRLAACGDDGTLIVWDLAGGAVNLAIPRAHGAPIHGVAFSPDGSTLATAGGDQAVQLRDARTGRIRRTLRRDPAMSPTGPFFSVAFSPDGRQVAAACTGGLALIWDAGGDSDAVDRTRRAGLFRDVQPRRPARDHRERGRRRQDLGHRTRQGDARAAVHRPARRRGADARRLPAHRRRMGRRHDAPGTRGRSSASPARKPGGARDDRCTSAKRSQSVDPTASPPLRVASAWYTPTFAPFLTK